MFTRLISQLYKDWSLEKHQVPLGVMPVLYETHRSTGLTLEIPESEAIERYLARKFHLLGNDPWEETSINVFYCSSNAIMSLFVNKVLLAFPDTKTRELEKFVNKDVPVWIAQHEKWLAKNGSNGFYVGDQVKSPFLIFFHDPQKVGPSAQRREYLL